MQGVRGVFLVKCCAQSSHAVIRVLKSDFLESIDFRVPGLRYLDLSRAAEQPQPHLHSRAAKL